MAHPRERSDESTDTTFAEAIERLGDPNFALSENRTPPTKPRKKKGRSYDDQPDQLDVITGDTEQLSFGKRLNLYLSAKEILCRTLSVRSHLSTGSSSAKRMDQARRCSDKRIWREIGRGYVYQHLASFSLSRIFMALSLTFRKYVLGLHNLSCRILVVWMA